MDVCKICGNGFLESPDSLILCEHKDGFVHHGCCVDRCSQNRAPCAHCKAEYTKDN